MESITMNNSYFLAAMIGMVIILIIEAALAATWNHFYFTVGLPIYIKRIPVSLFSFPPLDFMRLEAEFTSSWRHKSLVFKQMDSNSYAFREKMLEMRWGRSSSEVMHGLLILDQSQQQVVVVGYANWWMLGLALLIVAMSLTFGSQGLLIAGVYLLVVLFVYALQLRRFSKVAHSVATQVMERR